jgi:hypothetical protein
VRATLQGAYARMKAQYRKLGIFGTGLETRKVDFDGERQA